MYWFCFIFLINGSCLNNKDEIRKSKITNLITLLFIYNNNDNNYNCLFNIYATDLFGQYNLQKFNYDCRIKINLESDGYTPKKVSYYGRNILRFNKESDGKC